MTEYCPKTNSFHITLTEDEWDRKCIAIWNSLKDYEYLTWDTVDFCMPPQLFWPKGLADQIVNYLQKKGKVSAFRD